MYTLYPLYSGGLWEAVIIIPISALYSLIAKDKIPIGVGFLKIYTRQKQLIFEDSGIGIDTKNLFIVFEKSFQENPSTKGFGIGLSIVKSYCDKYNITIKIDTKKDIGTKISLDLKYLTQN